MANEDMVKIKIKDSSGLREAEVPVDMKLLELVPEEQKKRSAPIVMATLDGAAVDLIYKVHGPCTVEFIDLTDPNARSVYQRSLIFLMLKAVYDITGEADDVAVKYSLNSGVYIEMEDGAEMSPDLVKKTEERMRKMIDEDIPFRRRLKTPVEISEDEKTDRRDAALFKNVPDINTVLAYYCEDFRAFFYGAIVPSAGYLKDFILTPYKKGAVLGMPGHSDPAAIEAFREEEGLFNTFREADRWGEIMEIKTTNDLNRRIREKKWREVIMVSEALHEKRIASIADMIKSRDSRIILIAGPSSSGKTTFSQRLCVQLRVNGIKPLYMGTDDYFVERDQTPLDENGKFDFENINAIDLKLFNEHLKALLEGEEVDLPVFDFISGSKRYGQKITKAKPGQPIVIEGIHALNDLLTSEIDESLKFKIYISPFAPLCVDRHNRLSITDTRLIRRIARDAVSRGKSAKDTIAGWPSVREGERKNIFPYCETADVFFNSSLIYETAVLKPIVKPMLEEITRSDREYVEARRLINVLGSTEAIEDTSIVSNNSIIREFIGGGVFVL